MRFFAIAVGILSFSLCFATSASPLKEKQDALAQWRALTSSNSAAPRVFVKGHSTRVFFQQDGKPVAFKANWRPERVPTDKYRIAGARLRSSREVSLFYKKDPSWREARVLNG